MVSGKVQRTGYRDKIVELGRSIGLTGYAENLPDGRVKVVAEGEEKELAHLAKAASIKNALITVEDIESTYSEATGEFRDFYKLVKGGETDERLDTAAHLLKELIDTTKHGFGSLNNTMNSGFNTMNSGFNTMNSGFNTITERQDRMLEKQDATIRILERVSEDASDMRSTLSRIEVDVKDTKFSLSSFIEEKFRKQEGEIAEIKATLAKMHG